jgi:hypothetical protein
LVDPVHAAGAAGGAGGAGGVLRFFQTDHATPKTVMKAPISSLAWSTVTRPLATKKPPPNESPWRTIDLIESFISGSSYQSTGLAQPKPRGHQTASIETA